MKKVLIYTTGTCPYCERAKELLTFKGASFAEIRVDNDPDKRIEMEHLSSRRSVPQIFIGDVHVGGFDDLKDLNDKGKLDSLLA